MKQLREIKYIIPIALTALLFITRYILITDPFFTVDPDESIVGIMSAKLLNGEIIPPCFLGQKYGLSIFETFFIAGSSLFIKDYQSALHFGILLLWLVGFINFYAIIRDNSSQKNAVILSLILILSPTWFIWSLKARGGYVTGFALCQIILRQIYKKDNTKINCLQLLIIGTLLSLTYFSQIIWLIAALPFVIYRYLSPPKIKKILPLVTGFLITSSIIYILNNNFNNISNSWFPPIFSFNHIITNMEQITYKLLVYFSGAYYYYQNYLTPVTGLYAFIMLIFFILTSYYNIKSIFKQNHISLANIPTISCLSLLIFLLFFNSQWLAFRYFIPIFSIFLLSHMKKSIKKGKTIILLAIFSLSIFSLKDLLPSKKVFNRNYSELPAISKLTQTLKNNNINHVYALDIQHSLQYQIIFYSKQKILARELLLIDRFQDISFKVDEAFKSGKKTALIVDLPNLRMVTSILEQMNYKLDKVINIANSYYILTGINKELLRALNFELSFV